MDLIAFRTPVRVECNYKIGIEREVRKKLSEMVQRLISSVTFYDSMKHHKVPVGSMFRYVHREIQS